MEPERIREILFRYYNGDTSLEEERDLKKYFKEAGIISPEFEHTKGMFSYFIKAGKIGYNDTRKTIRILAVASILILVLFLFSYKYFHNPSFDLVTCKNNTGNILKIVLSDNNIIWLNTNSEVIYPKKLTEHNADLSVKGEVYFEIFHKTFPYTIKANNAILKAEVSSSFNIKASTGAFSTEIAVDSGAIKVYQESTSNNMAMIVQSGYYCSVHNSKRFAFTSALQDANYKSWKTHEFVFSNTPIATVISVLAQYYNVSIELENKQMAYTGFSGVFKEKSLDEILENIQSELNYTSTNTGNVIVLTGND